MTGTLSCRTRWLSTETAPKVWLGNWRRWEWQRLEEAASDLRRLSPAPETEAEAEGHSVGPTWSGLLAARSAAEGLVLLQQKKITGSADPILPRLRDPAGRGSPNLFGAGRSCYFLPL